MKVGDTIKEKNLSMDTGRRMRVTKIEGSEIEGIDLESKRKIYGTIDEFLVV